jgi:hypothetical protein
MKKHAIHKHHWDLLAGKNDKQDVLIPNTKNWDIITIYFSSGGSARLKIFYMEGGSTKKNPFVTPNDETPIIVVVNNGGTRKLGYNDSLYKFVGNGNHSFRFKVKNLELRDQRVDLAVIVEET